MEVVVEAGGDTGPGAGVDTGATSGIGSMGITGARLGDGSGAAAAMLFLRVSGLGVTRSFSLREQVVVV